MDKIFSFFLAALLILQLNVFLWCARVRSSAEGKKRIFSRFLILFKGRPFALAPTCVCVFATIFFSHALTQSLNRRCRFSPGVKKQKTILRKSMGGARARAEMVDARALN